MKKEKYEVGDIINYTLHNKYYEGEIYFIFKSRGHIRIKVIYSTYPELEGKTSVVSEKNKTIKRGKSERPKQQPPRNN